VIKHLPWTAFCFKAPDWEHVNNMRSIVSDANKIQQVFSHDRQATLWRAIPAFEELQTAWEEKHNASQYLQFKDAIDAALTKITKYYNKFDDKFVYILALGTLACSSFFYLLMYYY
jgi:hypothetical protein